MSVDIFDANVWIFGTTGNADEPVRLVREAETGARTVVLDAYGYNEVLNALRNSSHPEAPDVLQTRFVELVEGAPTIHTPSREAVQRESVAETRADVRIRTLARVLAVQPKDAPMVTLAYDHRDSRPTIHTADGPFAEFEPADYRLERLSVNRIALD